jgi:two-component system, sensor histidine kinase YesM
MSIELAANEHIPGYLEKFIAFFSSIRISLRSKIIVSFFTVIILLSATNALLVLEVMDFNHKYDATITNITTANSINGYIKPAIDMEMWNIVAGKKEFKNGSQYQIIDQVNNQIESMMANVSTDKSRIKLEVIRRTMNSLTRYVDKMGLQIEQGSLVSENERVLKDIRSVSDVVETSTQEYMLFEVNQAEQEYKDNKNRFTQLVILYLILLPCVVAFSFAAAWVISASIYIPIKKLQDVTTTITRNDLQALVTRNNVDEITELGMSFNIMIGKIRQMLDAKIKEQETLKKAELKALQAQINPHFLYNTLDTIVWMAQANKTAEVIDIVQALSNFFRIALSKGQDWITIGQEIEHIRSYLTIQKLRYHDILDYKIEVDEDILSGTILKLTLQPLVENALYHGIKNKRNGGRITVRARRAGPDQVMLEIIDDGVGFTPYKLSKIQESLEDETGEISLSEGGFGLENVHKRIQLYYGKQYGLTIQSKYQEGTRVRVTIPLQVNTNPLPGKEAVFQ